MPAFFVVRRRPSCCQSHAAYPLRKTPQLVGSIPTGAIGLGGGRRQARPPLAALSCRPYRSSGHCRPEVLSLGQLSPLSRRPHRHDQGAHRNGQAPYRCYQSRHIGHVIPPVYVSTVRSVPPAWRRHSPKCSGIMVRLADYPQGGQLRATRRQRQDRNRHEVGRGATCLGPRRQSGLACRAVRTPAIMSVPKTAHDR